MTLQGNILDYFVVFWAGVLVSFSPCLYPVMPITATTIAAANTQGTRVKGLVLSLIYVLGLAVVYCTLAAFAALSGHIFGQVQNHPATFMAIAISLVLFALVMLDILRLPSAGINLQPKARTRNVISIFFLGMTSGLMVSPCTAPALGALLLYVGYKQNILHGISLMFVFSLGVGASLVLVGTFSGLLGSLPKSGPWLIRIKQFCALILLMAAGFFLLKAIRLIV